MSIALKNCGRKWTSEPIDKTAPSQTESISFEFDLHHSPEKVWRALTDPELAAWLLPIVDLKLEQDALAESGYVGVPDQLRARLQRRSH